MILSVIGVLITFGAIIFIHEFGHFVAARGVGIRVEQFAFGFGKALWKKKIGDTEYRVNWIPLGGYVKPAGEDIENTSGAQDEYFSKPWYKRLIVVVSGASMNYVLAFVLFAGLAYFLGDPKASNETIVGGVSENFPAAVAGIKEGDRVLAVNGKTVSQWEEMAKLIRESGDKELTLALERAGKKEDIKLTPKIDPVQGYPIIGIAPSIGYEKIGLFAAMAAGAQQCWYWSALTIKSLFNSARKGKKPDVAGPIGIVQVVGKAVHTGIENFIFLIALLSVAVGLFNLFPIPVLDGGTALLFIYEGISGRKLTEKLIVKANSVGFVILIGIFLFATYSDIARIMGGRSKAAKTETKQNVTENAPAPKTETKAAAKDIQEQAKETAVSQAENIVQTNQ